MKTDRLEANLLPTRTTVARRAWFGLSRTREYVARQIAAGRTKKETIRLLKRAIAREMFRCLTAVARRFGLWPATISTLVRGTRRDDDLAHAYRNWLQAA
ncbi:hypothetical protein [Streptomyces acidicola]|uniref:hypothetical protein n=1 Tax=Streptomyces acidicola TaxID=2596892 RepID=UPI00381EDD5C